MLGLPRIYWAGVAALTLFAAGLAADHALAQTLREMMSAQAERRDAPRSFFGFKV